MAELTSIVALPVPAYIALTLGMIVYFLGAWLTRRSALLRDWNIPEPVSGGLAAALLVLLVYLLFRVEPAFDLTARDRLLVIFFTTIGLNARFADLLRGGRPLAILLGLTVGFMVVQNLVALAGVSILGLPHAAAVLLGTASLIGGHGTTIAWAPEIERDFAVAGALELGIAAATLGLVLASVIGGPIARFLVERRGLAPRDEQAPPVVGLRFDAEGETRIDVITLMRVLVVVNITVILGYLAHQALDEAGVRLPLFVPCLIAGIAVANLQPLVFPRLPRVSGTPTLALVSEFSLSVFLSMSLMSMQLWTLAGLAGPLLAILAVQAAVTVGFIVLVLFPLMGGTYRAAVLGSGFAGFALGATPTAIANMTAVTKRYGPAPVAFIILPLVSAFFVDLANALIIKAFLSF